MLFAACTRQEEPALAAGPQTEFVLGTVCSVNLYQFGSKERYSNVFALLRDLEYTLSATMPGTLLDTINQKSGLEPVSITSELYSLLETSLWYAQRTEGAFDPAIGPLVKLWGIGTDKGRRPGPDEIAEKLLLTDYRKVRLARSANDERSGSVFLEDTGMALDLGAIAKGYAADVVADFLRQEGVEYALIDLGGNILVLGSRPPSGNTDARNAPWRIGIQDPLEQRGTFLGVMELSDKSLVTSGVYERFMEHEDKRYHHILSSRDGYPVKNGLIAVTVAADRSTDADALSTSLFALGYEKALAFLESAELKAQAGQVYAVFVFADRRICLSRGTERLFQLRSSQYHLE
ncbi:FAD:protein FMN transferase [Spirochaetia bacterium]|nr:FAD:protein FMN transferase [Spirochaetia bacterium]